MKPMTSEDYVWIVNVLAGAGLALTFTLRGLSAKYRWFHLFVTLSTVVSVCFFYVRYGLRNDNLYATLFMGWAYLAPVFYFLIMAEMGRLVLGSFPAIEAASRGILRIVWGVLAILGICIYFYLSQVSEVPYATLKAAFSYQQAATTGLALFVLAFLGFVAWMPVPMTRSNLWHCFLLGGFFGSLAASRLIVTLNDFGWARGAASYVGMAGSIATFTGWMILVREESANPPLNTTKGPVSRDDADFFLARLGELNRTLANSGPRFLR